MSKEEIINRIDEIIEYSKLSTDIGFADQTDKINAIEGLLDLYQKEKEKNKELEEDIKVLKYKIIQIRNLTTPYCVWFDTTTNNYNLKGFSKQELYKIFAKIRESLKGEYIFLSNKEYLKELLQEGDK